MSTNTERKMPDDHLRIVRAISNDLKHEFIKSMTHHAGQDDGTVCFPLIDCAVWALMRFHICTVMSELDTEDRMQYVLNSQAAYDHTISDVLEELKHKESHKC